MGRTVTVIGEVGNMDRTTIKDVVPVFERFIKHIGGKVATKYSDVGAYQLDYNAAYGGCVIDIIMNESGGINRPFGDRRYSPSVFVDMLNFAMRIGSR